MIVRNAARSINTIADAGASQCLLQNAAGQASGLRNATDQANICCEIQLQLAASHTPSVTQNTELTPRV
jgi:DNA-binding FrmR family transcriptional regulator